MSLVSLDSVLTYMDLSSGVADTLISLLISDYSEKITSFCGRNFEQSTYYETFDIDSGTEKSIKLNYTPVISVVALTDNGSLVDTDDYRWYRNGRVTLVNSYFTKGLQKVEISYVAGFTPVPADIQLATCRLVEEDYYGRLARQKGFLTEKIGDYSYRLPDMNRFKDTRGFPPDVYSTLMQYIVVTGGSFGQ